MVSFRKLVLVLAVVGLMTGIASAQISNCTVSAPNVIVRAEGLTEPIGNVVITCAVSNITTSQTANFVIKLGSSSFTNSTTSTASSPANTATITAAAGGAPSSAITGVYPSSTTTNEIDFNNVSLPFGAGSTLLTVTISNLRVNASAVGAGSTLSATVTGTGVTPGFSQNILSQSVNVATVQQGLAFSVSGASSLAQCSNATSSATISFKPNFAYAFRPFSGTNSEPTEPGNSTASKGVQLVAIFSGLPANTKLTLPATLTSTSGGSASLISPTTNPVTTSGATQTVIYRVDTLGTSLTEAFTGSITVQATGGTIGLGQIQVRGNLGPISTATGPLATSDSGDVLPRFADQGATAANFVNVVPCQTTLLFPYIVSQGGFDTGIALSNTAKDIKTGSTWLFGGSSELSGQPGTCTLNYFGNTTSTGGSTAAQTTAAIAPGAVEVFLLGQNSTTDAGVTARPGFVGYMIANCNFVNAHGFAFITSGPGGMTMGYNALVIGTRTAVGGQLLPSLTGTVSSGVVTLSPVPGPEGLTQ